MLSDRKGVARRLGLRRCKEPPSAARAAGVDERRGGRPAPARDLGVTEAGRPPLALVVDDDPLQADQIADFLRARGIATETAPDGRAALDRVAREAPRVVITDIDMPRMDGIAFARALAALPNPPRIIMISGEPDKVVAANRARLGVFAVVDKPVPLRALETFVRKSIAR